MDVVKRNVFWIVLGAVLVVILGLYLIEVRPLRSKAAGLLGELNGISTEMIMLSKDPKKVPNDEMIKAVGTRKAGVSTELKAVEAKLLTKQLDVTKAGFEPPPPPSTNMVDYRLWLGAQYDKRDAKAREAGMKLLGSRPSDRGDYDTAVAIPGDEYALSLKRLLITTRALEALAKNKVTVTEKKLKEGSDEEAPVEVTRGIEHLMRLEFVDGAAMPSRRGKERGDAGFGGMSGGGGLPPAPPMVKDMPYREHLFELEFRGHASAVLMAIRELERIPDFLLVVRRADVRPVPPQKVERFSGPAPRTSGGDEAAAGKELANRRDREAPVQAILECAVFEFDFAAAVAGKKGKE